MELISKLKAVKNENECLRIENDKIQKQLFSEAKIKVELEQKVMALIEQHKIYENKVQADN
jgi:regulator of replication initiation timing